MLCLCALRGGHQTVSVEIQSQNPKSSHPTGVKIPPISVHLVSSVLVYAVCQMWEGLNRLVQVPAQKLHIITRKKD